MSDVTAINSTGQQETIFVWDENGEPLQIFAFQLNYFVRRGFNRSKVDPKEELKNLIPSIHAAAKTLEQLVKNADKNNQIAEEDLIAAQTALNKVTQSWNETIQSLQTLYPLQSTAKPKTMYRANGEQVLVDPSQVEALDQDKSMDVWKGKS